MVAESSPTDLKPKREWVGWMAVARVNKIKQGNLEEYQGYGNKGLEVLEGRLEKNEWLALGRPTIADLACYPYTVVSPEGGFKLENYPAVQAWLKRVEALPGWVKRV